MRSDSITPFNSFEDLEIRRTKLRDVFAKLTPELLTKGLRTFEINGMRSMVGFKTCFVACMYGKPISLGDFTDVGKQVGLVWHDLERLSGEHYLCPTFLHEEVTMWLIRNQPKPVPA